MIYVFKFSCRNPNHGIISNTEKITDFWKIQSVNVVKLIPVWQNANTNKIT